MPIKPSLYVNQMSELLRYSEMMPRAGAQCTNLIKTTTFWNDLPEEAKDYKN